MAVDFLFWLWQACSFGPLPAQQANSYLQPPEKISFCDHPNVRQRKPQEQPTGILCQDPVTCLSMPELALNHSKLMLHLNTNAFLEYSLPLCAWLGLVLFSALRLCDIMSICQSISGCCSWFSLRFLTRGIPSRRRLLLFDHGAGHVPVSHRSNWPQWSLRCEPSQFQHPRQCGHACQNSIN